MNRKVNLELLRSLRLQGNTVYQIREATGWGESTISKYLAGMGLTGQNGKRSMPNEDKREEAQKERWRLAMPW